MACADTKEDSIAGSFLVKQLALLSEEGKVVESWEMANMFLALPFLAGKPKSFVTDFTDSADCSSASVKIREIRG